MLSDSNKTEDRLSEKPRLEYVRASIDKRSSRAMTASDAELLEMLKLKEPREQTDQLRKWPVCSVASDRKTNVIEGLRTRIIVFHYIISGKSKRGEKSKSTVKEYGEVQ